MNIVWWLIGIWTFGGLFITVFDMNGDISEFHDNYNWKQKIFICFVGGPAICLIVIIGYLFFFWYFGYHVLLDKLEDKPMETKDKLECINDKC